VGLAEGCELQRSGAWSLRLDSLIAVASDTKLYATQTIGFGLIAFDSPNLAGTTSGSGLRRLLPRSPRRDWHLNPRFVLHFSDIMRTPWISSLLSGPLSKRLSCC
jgi:hypothetical protein